MYDVQGRLTIDLTPATDLNNMDTSTVDAIQGALETVQRNITELQNHFGSPAVFGMSIDKTQSVIARTESQLKTALAGLKQLKIDAYDLEKILMQAYGESP